MIDSTNKSWFETWFDSPYYPLLYAHRNDLEAQNFIIKIFKSLNIKKGSFCLDLACGRGRHAQIMSNIGAVVDGIDLSENSISDANLNLNKNLQFHVADMRYFELNKKFDYIFNLFTSFGYFENESDNIAVLNQIKKHLTTKGVFVIDYLNINHAEISDTTKKQITIDGIQFQTQKFLNDYFIVKKIDVYDKDRYFQFEERVQKLDKNWFFNVFDRLGFEVISTFGSYDLEEFNNIESKRLILVVKVNNE